MKLNKDTIEDRLPIGTIPKDCKHEPKRLYLWQLKGNKVLYGATCKHCGTDYTIQDKMVYIKWGYKMLGVEEK